MLEASGRSLAPRDLLLGEQECNPTFQRVTNTLTTLYPRDSSEEKRLAGRHEPEGIEVIDESTNGGGKR